MFSKLLKFLLFSLTFGLYLNVLLGFYRVYLFDISVLFIFIYSIVKLKRYQNKKFNLFFGLFVLYLTILNLINTKLIFEIGSLLYLLRLVVYVYSYPFFIKLQLNINKYINTIYIFLFLSLTLNLVIFYFYPILSIFPFDPHRYRLYGQFLDPNYYGILCVFLLHFCINTFKKSNFILFFITFLCILSIFLTFSRLAFIGFILVLLFNFKKFKYIEYAYIGFFTVLLFFLNSNFLSRFLFIEGNFDSFFYRILSFIDASVLYTKAVIPLGFNNIASYSYFLTSNLNNSSSYFDFFVFNLLLTGGVIFVVIFSLFTTFASIKLTYAYRVTLFLLIFLSMGMNVLFAPYFMLVFSLILGKFFIKKIT